MQKKGLFDDDAKLYYAHDRHHGEPPVVGTVRTTVGLERNLGFSPQELRQLQKLIIQHQAALEEAWHGHLGANG